MKKVMEHTCGNHVYMKIELDGKVQERDVYFCGEKAVYRTTEDNKNKSERKRIINAFNLLY